MSYASTSISGGYITRFASLCRFKTDYSPGPLTISKWTELSGIYALPYFYIELWSLISFFINFTTTGMFLWQSLLTNESTLCSEVNAFRDLLLASTLPYRAWGAVKNCKVMTGGLQCEHTQRNWVEQYVHLRLSWTGTSLFRGKKRREEYTFCKRAFDSTELQCEIRSLYFGGLWIEIN